MIIAIDFDGTIVEDQFPEIGNLIPQAIDTILHFQECGHKLILWTCRENGNGRNYLEDAINFLAEYGIFFDAYNENLPDSPYAHLGNSRKIYADYYIDDKSRFPSWETYAGGML